jgi:hypothetical protein
MDIKGAGCAYISILATILSIFEAFGGTRGPTIRESKFMICYHPFHIVYDEPSPKSCYRSKHSSSQLFLVIRQSNATMSRQDIEFKTSDNVTLRGWLYTPSKNQALPSRLPCLVMSHAFAMLKEMGLDTFAEHFVSQLRMACLVFDNRGLGSSDVKEGQPRNEMLPSI